MSHRACRTRVVAYAALPVLDLLERRVLMAAELVADLTPGSGSSLPHQFVDVDGTMFFIADDGVHGRELWKSDGTAEGTALVKDINPGPGHGLTPQLLMTGSRGALIFAANDGVRGVEVWRSDGTAAGTTLLKDIRPGSGGSNPGLRMGDDERTYLAVGDTVYFRADDGTLGYELWRTDGTAEGTKLVKDLNPGPIGSFPGEMTELDGKLIYAAGTEVTGRELFRSDGTPEGTFLLKNFDNSQFSSNPTELTASGGYVYFRSSLTGDESRLRRTDGTPSGTVSVGGAPGRIRHLTDVGGTLYLMAEINTARELWKRDAGTGALTRVGPPWSAGGPETPEFMTDVGGTLYFTAFQGGTNLRHLWRSDGTDAGTRIVTRVVQPDSANGWKRRFTPMGDGFVFIGNAGEGRRLWFSDGTEQGTRRLLDAPLDGNDFTRRPNLGVAGGAAFIPASAADKGLELFRADGSPDGSGLLNDINQIGLSTNPVLGGALNGLLYFAGNQGFSPYRSDGTAAGTGPFPPGGLSQRDFTTVGDLLYYTARDPSRSELALMRTDGTAAGTFAVKDRAIVSGDPVEMGGVGTTLFFNGFDPSTGVELWKSNGTRNETMLVKDISTGNSSSTPQDPTPFNGMLYFSARSHAEGREIWVSDGTQGGTVVLADITPGEGSSSPRELTVAGDALFFLADGAGNSVWLWRSDGSTAGTAPVMPLAGVVPGSLTSANGQLFFVRDHAQTGRELWRSDGTPQGTVLVKDIAPGPASSGVATLLAVGRVLYFRASDPATGAELWKTDGTPEGTVLVKDVVPGPGGSGATPALNANGLLVFTADDGEHGLEAWRSDGTSDGTFLLADVNPGPRPSTPGGFTLVGDTLYFRALADTTGVELWKSTDIPQPLRAEAGGGYVVDEGQSITLSTAGSTGTIVSYEWDFDYHPSAGFQADAAGPSPSFRGLDGLSFHTVALRVTSPDGETHIDTAQVRVDNVAPVLHAAGPDTVRHGQPFVLKLTSSDPGADSVVSWKIEWGDGSVEMVAGNASTASHVYAHSRKFTHRSIFVWATDEDGTYPITPQGGLTVGGLDPSFSNDGVSAALYESASVPPIIADTLVQSDGKVLVLSTDGRIWRLKPDGSLDPSFGGDGLIENGPVSPHEPSSSHRAFLQPDGRLVTIGGRFNRDGSRDPSFNIRVPMNGFDPRSIAPVPGGRFLLTGRFRHEGSGGVRWSMGVIRLNADGSLDRSFGAGGAVSIIFGSIDNFGLAAQPLPDGRILVAGNVGLDRDSQFALTRLNADGSIDPAFGGPSPGPAGPGKILTSLGQHTIAYDYAFLDDGKILAVGRAFDNLAMVRYSADGTLDASFGNGGAVVLSGGVTSGRSVAVEPTGRIVVSGLYQGEFALFRFLPDGSPDPTFGPGGVGRTPNPFNPHNGFGSAAAVGPDGRIVVASSSSETGNTKAFVARFVQSPLSVRVIPPHAPPKVTSFLVNGGGAQRSMVNSVVVRFDHPVTLSPGAATLVRRKEHAADPASGSAVSVVIRSVSKDRRSVTLTFSGPGVSFGSLIDGVYDLTLSPELIEDDYGQTLTGTTTLTFHRLFGDATGNGDVSGQEQQLVRDAVGSTAKAAASGYVWYLDADADGDIDRLDWKEAQRRLGKRYRYLPFSSAPAIRPISVTSALHPARR